LRENWNLGYLSGGPGVERGILILPEKILAKRKGRNVKKEEISFTKSIEKEKDVERIGISVPFRGYPHCVRLRND